MSYVIYFTRSDTLFTNRFCIYFIFNWNSFRSFSSASFFFLLMSSNERRKNFFFSFLFFTIKFSSCYAWIAWKKKNDAYFNNKKEKKNNWKSALDSVWLFLFWRNTQIKFTNYFAGFLAFWLSIDEFTIFLFFFYYLMWLEFGWIRMFPFRVRQLPYSSTLFGFAIKLWRIHNHTTWFRCDCIIDLWRIVAAFNIRFKWKSVVFFFTFNLTVGVNDKCRWINSNEMKMR